MGKGHCIGFIQIAMYAVIKSITLLMLGAECSREEEPKNDLEGNIFVVG